MRTERSAAAESFGPGVVVSRGTDRGRGAEAPRGCADRGRTEAPRCEDGRPTIAHRAFAQLPLKLALSVALTAYFCVPYFALQAWSVFPVRTLPLTWADRAVGFSPGWVWAYQSVYLLIAVVPWLAVDRGTLVRYARGFVLLSSLAFACFFFLPVVGPRPADIPTSGMFALLVSYDRPSNAFPSLHCGLAAYSLLLAREVSRGSLPAWWRQAILGCLASWVVLICYATLATKQHYLVDLPPGILLAWLCHRWAWRGASR